jgi:enoyl-CoA hydratase/carnithine racemase
MAQHPDLGVEFSGRVATVELRRPPHNYFDAGLLAGLADIYETLGCDGQCRAIVLAASGRAFCAGADHGRAEAAQSPAAAPSLSPVSREAIRLFRSPIPVVAAVHGAAVGGGLGLALSTDFRVTCPEARFWPNFSRLGFHAGFGLTCTLPRLVGAQQASLLLYAGRRLTGEEAFAVGLAEALVPENEVRSRSLALAEEIASASPLAVRSMRHTLRRGLADAVEIAMERELLEQTWQRQTEDFGEGVRAMAERRLPVFRGC